jgi:putative transposase
VQSRRDKKAAKRLFRKLLKAQGRSLRVLITDKLRTHAAAKREICPASTTASTRASTTGRRIPTNRRNGESGS